MGMLHGPRVVNHTMRGRKPIPNVLSFPNASPVDAVEVQSPLPLSGEAEKCWRHVTEEMRRAGTLSEDCLHSIAIYCINWARLVEAEEKVKLLGSIIKAPKTQVPMHNPYLPVANRAAEMVMKLAAELGITPVSRARVSKAQSHRKVTRPADAFLKPR